MSSFATLWMFAKLYGYSNLVTKVIPLASSICFLIQRKKIHPFNKGQNTHKELPFLFPFFVELSEFIKSFIMLYILKSYNKILEPK